MRYLLLIFPVLLALSSCHPKIQETDTASLYGQDSVETKYLILARSLPDSTRKIGPYIYTQLDTGNFDGAEILDSPYLAIGHVIDSVNIFAIACRNVSDTSAILKMYRLDNDKWKLVGKYTIPFYVILLHAENMDSDKQRREIILISARNMNGNQERWFFKYDPLTDVFKYSGWTFSTDDDLSGGTGGMEIDRDHNIIKVDYQGSWYMDQFKSLYIWHNDSLVLLRESSMQIIDQAKAQKGIYNNQLEYMVNKDTTFSGGLTTIFSERDNESSLHHKKYWEEFFDLK